MRPLVLIGSDHVHLITADKPVRQGSKGGPIAVHTALGWALQGTEESTPSHNSVHQCLFVSTACPDDLLYRNVEKLWQLDILPYQNDELVVRSREDQEVIKLLECKTQRITVERCSALCHPPRLVFNCSFRYQGLSLNDQLLTGPALGPSLLGVLLRFRHNHVAESADIHGMFHQVCLLPED